MLNLNYEKYKGLSENEVKEKLIKEGYNELPSSKPKGMLDIAAGVIKEPMFILLVMCGSLYLMLGDFKEGIMLLCFVFVIMGIEFYQERKTERALDALKDLASPRALVIRDGKEKRIAGREVVTEDIIVLQEGDRVPADATVLYSVNLMADESLLTGESVPVRKIEWDQTKPICQPGGDDMPFVYSGTMIVQGNGIVKVDHIGTGTEIGKIGKALENVTEEETKLKKEMGSLVKKLTVFGFSLCVIVIILYTLTRGSVIKGFLAGITLAMALLPEEFPVVLTIFMALGAWRMSRKSVLTRKPSAIETLGSATVLCTDKTGTLTQNKMSVSLLYNGHNYLDAAQNKNLPEEFHEIVEYGILASQTTPFDPMEKAIKNLGDQYLNDTEHIHNDWEMKKEYPLSKELLAMSRVFSKSNDTNRVIATKGAPEAILDLCHASDEEIKRISGEIQKMASLGLRVLGVAKAKINGTNLPEIQHDFDFKFMGLIGLADPIRENVKDAVSECITAGIRVIMITGDYPVTAKNIAQTIGIKNHELVITGAQLQEMSETELKEKIKNVNVFARVIPEQKLKIVNALKQNNEIVAMTGDGVNDAPALKSAHIGIAMGEKGTDVAREASSLVLMDDNFASIVGAVRMGRRIFDNLQKALGYIFAIHVPIAGLSLIPILFSDLPIILWPAHIVFLELIIDPACSIIFEAENEEKNIMNRAPKKIDEPFFDYKKILLSCTQGICILVIVLLVYGVGLYLGHGEKEVRALTFTTLIVANIAVILSNRSWTRNITEIVTIPNNAVKWVIGGAVLFLALILNIHFLREIFQFEVLHAIDIFLCTIAGLATISWFEVFKYLKLKKNKLV